MTKKTAIQRICDALGRRQDRGREPGGQPQKPERIKVVPASRSVSYENRPTDAGEPEGVDWKRAFNGGKGGDV